MGPADRSQPNAMKLLPGSYLLRASAMDMADLRQHLDINYIGALNVLHALVPALIARVSEAPRFSTWP